MSDLYDFSAQLSQGEEGEHRLDLYFRRWFDIHPATPEEQRRGIDRVFRDRKRRREFTIEYKTDNAAAQTGNAFIETISVDTANKAGWVYTSEADLLLYYVPDYGRVYIIQPQMLRARLAEWLAVFPARKIPNDGYFTHGVLVPLPSLRQVARRVLNGV